VPSGDSSALIEAIRRLLRDSKLRDTMSKHALEVARAHTWETIAREQLMPFYEDSLS
jgi:glycosyltransferase involved in cell wall biosynthesis